MNKLLMQGATNNLLNNPQVQQIMQLCKMKGMSPEQLARQMAQQRGIDINRLLNQAQQQMNNNNL